VEERVLPAVTSPQWRDPALDACYAPVVELALKEANQPLPEIADNLYAVFHQTGDRLGFENIYFERRRRLARSAVALLRCQDKPHERALLEASLQSKL